MSLLESEAVAFVDPYMLDRDMLDPDDPEHGEVLKKLKAMNAARERRSVGGGGGGSRANVEQMSVMTPVDTSACYFTHVAIANNTFVAISNDGNVHFFDQSNTIKMASLPLRPAPGRGKSHADAVESLYFDPLGRHAVVVTQYSAFYYHLKRDAKPTRHDVSVRADAGVAGFAIGSLAWDPNNTFEASSGEVLLGSKKGASLVVTRFDSAGMARETKRVFEFPTEAEVPTISSIIVVPHANAGPNRSKKIILVATGAKLFYFVGFGNCEMLFDLFDGVEQLHNYFTFDMRTDSVRDPRLSTVTALTAKRNEVLPPCFMWCIGNRFLMEGTINVDVLGPQPGSGGGGADDADSSTSVPHDVLHRTVEIDVQRLVNDGPQPLTAGLAKPMTALMNSKETPLRVLQVAASYFFITITTTSSVRVVAHPACLPWRPLELPAGASSGRDAAMHRGHGSLALPPSLTLRPSLRSLSAAADADHPLSQPAPSASSVSGTGAAPQIGYRELRCRCIFEYSLVIGGETGSGASVADGGGPRGMADLSHEHTAMPPSLLGGAVLPAGAGVARLPTSPKSEQQAQQKLRYKKDSAVGVLFDTRTTSMYLVTATKLVEVTPTSAVRRQFLPLFIREARRHGLVSSSTSTTSPSLLGSFASRSALAEPHNGGVEGGGGLGTLDTPAAAAAARPASGPGSLVAIRRDPFAMACSLAMTKKAAAAVTRAKAEWLLAMGDYCSAALLLAEPTTRGVDDILLMLAGLPTTEPLLIFLNQRIENILRDRRTFDEAQIELHCLASWTVTLLLDRCNHEAIDAAREERLAADRPLFLQQQIEQQREAEREGRASASEQLQRFLNDHVDTLSWGSLCEGVRLIGNERETVLICRLMKRLDEVLEQFILYHRYVEALNLLVEHASASPIFRPLWERYNHTFLRHLPVRLIRHGWIPHGATLGVDPLHLIPVLGHYRREYNESGAAAAGFSAGASYDDLAGQDPGGATDADADRVPDHMGIVYLRHVIDTEGNIDRSIHNLLVQFLVTDGSDAELVNFLRSSRFFDRELALRLCAAHNRVPARVEVYFLLGFLREAVHLALSVGNVALAKEYIIAIKPGVPGAGESPKQLRTELWEDVIAHVARREGGPRNALLLLAESGDDVNVSHVLPHFNNDVMICEFKNELIANVRRFGRLMTSVREEIVSATASADNLRRDLEEEKRKCTRFSVQKKCDACGQIALSRPVIAFQGCRHVFHVQCFRSQSAISIAKAGEECHLCATDFPRAFLTRPLNTSDKKLNLGVSL